MDNIDKSVIGEDLVKIDLLDVLMDENNTDPIILYAKDNRPLKFDQIAVIPYGDEELYAFLRPISHIDGISEDEGVVFRVIENEDGEAALIVEQDEERVKDIYNRYLELIAETDESAE